MTILSDGTFLPFRDPYLPPRFVLERGERVKFTLGQHKPDIDQHHCLVAVEIQEDGIRATDVSDDGMFEAVVECVGLNGYPAALLGLFKLPVRGTMRRRRPLVRRVNPDGNALDQQLAGMVRQALHGYLSVPVPVL